MRLACGSGLVAQGVVGLIERPPIGLASFDVLATIAGVLLLAGLWTPIAGALAAIIEIATACFLHPYDPWANALLATTGVALALIGPGAWSVDARLYGWKRIEIRDRQT